MTIRKTILEDSGAVYKIICELENTKFRYDCFLNLFEENLNKPEYFYFSAIQNNQMIGFISCHSQNLLHHCGRVGEIQEMYVDHNFRKKGIGRLLLTEILKVAKSSNFKSLEVTSNMKRIENVDIYKQLGFSLSHNKFTMKIRE